MTSPVIMALEHAGRWLTQAELLRALIATLRNEDHIASDIVLHLNRGELQSRMRIVDEAGDLLPRDALHVWEFGLPDWPINESNVPDPAEQLARIQRITSADWARPLATTKEPA